MYQGDCFYFPFVYYYTLNNLITRHKVYFLCLHMNIDDVQDEYIAVSTEYLH